MVVYRETYGKKYRMPHTYLLRGSLHDYPHTGWEVGESLLQETVVCDAILLKAVEKGCWCVLHLRLFNDHHTLKVRVHTRWLSVRSNGNVGVVMSALFGIINLAKALIE